MDTYSKAWYNMDIIKKVRQFLELTMDNERRRHTLGENEKKVSPAQRKATDKYLEKFDEMRVRIPKGQKAIVQAHCEVCGESLNGFIARAISETMERDKMPQQGQEDAT